MATNLLNKFKGKLFWKIFLGLWLSSTLLLIVPAWIFSQIALRTLPGNIQSRVESIILTTAQSGLLEYRVKGPEEFERTLKNVNAQLDIDIYIFSDAGKPLTGKEAPNSTRPYLNELLQGRESPFQAVENTPGRFSMARWLSFENEQYALVAYFQIPGGPDMTILPSLWPMLLASLLIAGIGSAFAAKALVSPIYELQSVTRRFAAGHLHERIGPSLRPRHDEFSDLGNDFDWMAERLENLIEAKQKLMRDISHELRSPLARIRLALAITNKPDKFTDALKRIERDVERMDVLIGEILTLAKLEHSTLSLQHEAIDLGEFCEDIVEESQMEAQSKQQHLSCKVHDSIKLLADTTLLHRAIENIVRNALQHTPANSQVILEVRHIDQTDMVEVSVTDNGPGVPANMLSALCEPFFRIEGGHGKGSGLGLSIAQRVAQLHGGTLQARQSPASTGLQISILLPTSHDFRAT
jgi:signal transduction histidine kinase